MKKFGMGVRAWTAVLALALLCPLNAFAADESGSGEAEGPEEPIYVADFYTEEGYEAEKINNVNSCELSYDAESKALDVIASENGSLLAGYYDGDTYYTLRKLSDSEFSCDDYPYMVLRMKNLSDATTFEFLFSSSGTPNMGDGTSCHFAIEPNMTEFKTYVVDVREANIQGMEDYFFSASEDNWRGKIKNLRFDGLYFDSNGGVPLGAEYQLQWVAFFATEEAASAYTGPRGEDATMEQNPPVLEKEPEPTEVPATEEPVDEPTETPAAGDPTATVAATEGSDTSSSSKPASTNTPAPTNTDRDSSSSPMVWIVIAVVAVVVIAVVVVIVVKKKKK